MKNIKFFVLIFCIFTLMTLLGGCGGSSNENKKVVTLSLSLDEDDNRLPDIFEHSTKVGGIYSKNGNSYEVPYVNYIRSDMLN